MKKEEKLTLKEHNKQLLSDSKAAGKSDTKQMSIVAMNDDGEVVHHFPNRMAASRFIVEHIKGGDPTDRSLAMKVYGNLYHGLKNTWRVYGFFWKLVPNGAPVTTDAYFIVNEKKCKYVVCYGMRELLSRFNGGSSRLDLSLISDTSESETPVIGDSNVVVLSNYEAFLAKNELLGLRLADSLEEILK